MTVMFRKLLHHYEHHRLFSQPEAWALFRLAAIGEAVGWTLLLSALLWQHFHLPGNTIPVQLAGQLHGMLFLAYLLAAIGLYPPLHWRRRWALLALLASLPPYGSLAFEQLMQRRRCTQTLCAMAGFQLLAKSYAEWR